MEWKYFAPIGMLYNVLLLINHYTSNITTKCHSKSMSDNRDLTGIFHQKISSLPVNISSGSRYFQSSLISFSVTKYSNLQLPVKAVYIEKAVVSQAVSSKGEATEKTQQGKNYTKLDKLGTRTAGSYTDKCVFICILMVL